MKTLDAPHKSTLDVLLINTGALKAVYQSLGENLSAIETPTLTALFATYLRNKNISVDILDAPAFNLSPDDVANYVTENLTPKLIVFPVYGFQPSASTQNMASASITCKALKNKKPSLKIMLTGTHPAALPRKTMEEEEAVDFVCDLEGPETIYKTIEFLLSETSSVIKIPSLWYRKGDEILHTAPGKLITNLDIEMPEPAFDLLPMDKYRAHNWHCFDHINNRQPYASIYTSLGCPYKCSFCCINTPFGSPSYRMWSSDTIIKQIDTLVNEYGVKNIKIIDEMFVLNKNHVISLCDKLIERNYDLNIWAYARIDTVKDEYLEKLKKAGIRWLALGIESASDHVRDGMEKGRFGKPEIIEVVRKIQAAGIYVIGNYIFGLPDDTYESMEETLELAIETNCEFSNFYSAMAYPGSALYTQATENNEELPDSWLAYSQHSYNCHPLSTKNLSSSEVLKFRDEAFTRFFTNNNYLKMLENKFSKEVVHHIEEVTAIALKRKLY